MRCSYRTRSRRQRPACRPGTVGLTKVTYDFILGPACLFVATHCQYGMYCIELLLPARWTRRLRHFHRFHRQALATPGVELVHSVGDSPVVSKCANPACSAPFRYLDVG